MAPKTIAEITLASLPGNDREAARRTAEALSLFALPQELMESIKTAVSEAVLNAMEHGNDNTAHLPVHIVIEVCDECVTISVYDRGLVRTLPEAPIEPDLFAKIAGEQRPRGWGLHLIRGMVDELTVHHEPARHCVEMVFYRGASE